MKTTGDIPKGRRGHSAAVVGNRMLVLGGHDEDNYFNDLYCLNFENAEWKQVSLKATVPRMAYHQCVTLGTSVLIYGGKRKNGSTTKVITPAPKII
jgi:N-acetylneuraminic acid mutarotase